MTSESLPVSTTSEMEDRLRIWAELHEAMAELEDRLRIWAELHEAVAEYLPPLSPVPPFTSYPIGDVSEAECGKSPKVMAKAAEEKSKPLADGSFEYVGKTDLQHLMDEGWDELCSNFFRLKKSAVTVLKYLPKCVRDLFHSACKAVSTSAKRMDKLLKVSKVLGARDRYQQKEKDAAGSTSSHQSAAEVLKQFQDAFLEAMDAKALCRRLALKGIIPEKVETEILRAESKEAANIILYRHLHEQGTEADLRQLCEIASMKKGYGMMNELGRKILEQLL